MELITTNLLSPRESNIIDKPFNTIVVEDAINFSKVRYSLVYNSLFFSS
jgi:hypothetical protein